MSDPQTARLKWLCRRGMRELDKLTEGYLERHYPLATSQEKAAFRELLELPDPELLALLYRQIQPDQSIKADVLQKMRQPA